MPDARLTPPADIQKTLNQIWDSLQGTNKMRASLFNLVLYTYKNDRALYIRKIAQKVIEKFPSRILLISIDKESSQDYLKTAVSVITAEKGEHDIACDFIEIEASLSSQTKVPFLILPHLLTDLPVYLVWAEDPSQKNPIALDLEKLSTRLIFDSETTDDLYRFANAILEHKNRSHCDIADLNWARLESWRDVISNTFYPLEKRVLLSKIQKIEISYNAHKTPFFCHTKIQALYLQSWLAAQLGWQIEKVTSSKNSQEIVYKSEGRSILVSLTPVDYSQLAPGFIASFDLFTEDSHHFSFKCNLNCPQEISMVASTSEKCDTPCQFVFPKGESGQSLVQEICHKGTSAHYLKVLNLITAMGALDK